jgi:ABC-type multidrug transport system fused ATPase/permease subunit
MIILYQNNFLGILTQNSNKMFWSNEIAGINLIMMLLGAMFYTFIFIFIVENAFGSYWQRLLTSSTKGENTTVEGRKSGKSGRSGRSGRSSRVNSTMIAMDEEPTNAMVDPHNIVVVSKAYQKEAKTNEDDISVERSVASVDPDVIREKEKVKQIVERGIVNRQESAIFINNLRKVYFARGSIPAKVAVKNINLSIPQGEIFGLLGANGKKKSYFPSYRHCVSLLLCRCW